MALERIGFASQLADGTWTPVQATETAARRYVRDMGVAVNRARVALPVLVEIPDVAPRPVVVLAGGERVRWSAARSVYVSNAVDYATLVALVKALPVTDADVDALQALPADTAAWIAAGGRD